MTLGVISIGENRASGLSSFGSDAGNLLSYFFGHWLFGGLLGGLFGGLDALDGQQLGLKDYDIN